jgi:hypothetical protein
MFSLQVLVGFSTFFGVIYAKVKSHARTAGASKIFPKEN